MESLNLLRRGLAFSTSLYVEEDAEDFEDDYGFIPEQFVSQHFLDQAKAADTDDEDDEELDDDEQAELDEQLALEVFGEMDDEDDERDVENTTGQSNDENGTQ